MAAVIGMGILIVAGVTVLVVVMVQRMSSLPAADARLAANNPAAPDQLTLDEPDGTRIAAATLGGERVVLSLSGGGRPDRVVIVDTRSGRVLGRVALAR